MERILSELDFSSAPSSTPPAALSGRCLIRGCDSTDLRGKCCEEHSCASRWCEYPSTEAVFNLKTTEGKKWCCDHSCPERFCPNDEKCPTHRCPGIFEDRGCTNFLRSGETFCPIHRCPKEGCPESSICVNHACMVVFCKGVRLNPDDHWCPNH